MSINTSNAAPLSRDQKWCIKRAVRMVLSNAETPIQRSFFSSIIKDTHSTMKLNDLIQSVKQNLEDVFGLTLKVSKQNEYFVASRLDPKTETLLKSLLNDPVEAEDSPENATNTLQYRGTVPGMTGSLPAVHEAVTVFCVSWIVLKGGKVSEEELNSVLDTCLLPKGVDRNTIAPYIPSLTPLFESGVLKKSNVTGTNAPVRSSMISLGSRTLTKISPETVYRYLSDVLFEGMELDESILASLKVTFPDFNFDVLSQQD